MQFTKLRSGPTWPPSRAPATNSKSTTPTFSRLYELRLGGRWKPCWPHSHTPFSLKIRRVKSNDVRQTQSFLPRNCSPACPASDARQPKPLASHALLHGVRS